MGLTLTEPADRTMRRRELIAIAGTGLVAWPLVARAQQQPRIARIGYLSFGDPAANSDRVAALRAGFRDVGYVEGKNLVIEFRWARTVDELNEAAAELVRMKVDIIFASLSRPGGRRVRSRSSSRRTPILKVLDTSQVSRGLAET